MAAMACGSSPLRTLVVLLALEGCGSSTKVTADSGPVCTEIGCGPALRVHFVRTGWPAATYHIETTADGNTASCDVVVPLSCTMGSACTGLAGFAAEVSGCALDPALHSVAGVLFMSSTPASVTLKVSQDGREIGSGSFSPTYTDARPNGPACDPVCHVASTETLSLMP
jgi:hypothetical protein